MFVKLKPKMYIYQCSESVSCPAGSDSPLVRNPCLARLVFSHCCSRLVWRSWDGELRILEQSGKPGDQETLLYGYKHGDNAGCDISLPTSRHSDSSRNHLWWRVLSPPLFLSSLDPDQASDLTPECLSPECPTPASPRLAPTVSSPLSTRWGEGPWVILFVLVRVMSQWEMTMPRWWWSLVVIKWPLCNHWLYFPPSPGCGVLPVHLRWLPQGLVCHWRGLQQQCDH